MPVVCGLSLGLSLWACATPTLRADREISAQDPMRAARRESGPPRRVILLTVAGLEASDFLDAWGHAVAPGSPVRMPNLARLAREGAMGLAALPPSPGATRASHATLATGRLPPSHGVVADAILDDEGTRSMPFLDNRLMSGTALWDAAIGRGVLALDWPTTAGARIELIVPEVGPSASWLDSIRPRSTPPIVRDLEAIAAADLAVSEGGPSASKRNLSSWPTPAEKDAALVGAACGVADSERDPALWLLRLDQTAIAQQTFGSGSLEVDRALGRVDVAIGRLIDCLTTAGRIEDSAIFVVGDVAYHPVHSAIAPNVALVAAGLIGRDPRATTGVRSWLAMARTQGRSAYVYARDATSALEARKVLEAEARRTKVFEVVSAKQLANAGADPQAWFGLVAAEGYAFDNAMTGEVVRPSQVRSAAGVLRLGDSGAAAVGLVAWGRGVRNQVRIPSLELADVAPTIAALLGLRLDDDVAGAAHLGILRAVVEPPPAGPKRLGAPSRSRADEALRDMRQGRVLRGDGSSSRDE